MTTAEPTPPLLTSRRFAPLFITQFLGALNDNLFKNAVLAQHLHDRELMAGNAIIEVGTFAAIILGTTLAALQLSSGDSGPFMVAAGLLLVAVLGWLASRAIAPAPAQVPAPAIDGAAKCSASSAQKPALALNPITASADLLHRTRRVKIAHCSKLPMTRSPRR